MILNKRPVIKILSAVMAIVGAAMLLPTVVALIYGEKECTAAFAACLVPTIAAGLILVFKIPTVDNASLRMRDGFFVVGAAWILMSLIGSLPFIITGAIPKFADAFFETASGFTTTGSSILDDIESLPRSILFWRSFTHWLGGMGVLVLTIAILPMLGIGGQKLMRAETTGPTMDRISFSLNDTAKALYLIYLGVTVSEIILLLICGCSLYDSLVHAFGTVGTGGFSSYGASISGLKNPAAEIVITVFMFICGVNFSLYYSAVKGDFKALYKDAEFRFYVKLVGGSMVFVTVMLMINNYYATFGETLRKSAFAVASIVSTTGYATADFDVWPLPIRFLMFFLMLTGGCASSTGGGIKVVRMMLFGKMVKRGIYRRLHPHSVAPIRIGGNTISQKTISEVAAFGLLYTATTCLGTILVSLEKVDMLTAFSSVVTCLSNIGPGFNLVGPSCSFSFYSGATKILLSLFMIAGRLELYTIILLFTREFWNKNR